MEQQILSIINELINPMTVIGCLLIGYMIKHLPIFENVKNRYIPTILIIVGAVILPALQGGYSIKNLIAGGASGLVATGLHQWFNQTFDIGSKSDE